MRVSYDAETEPTTLSVPSLINSLSWSSVISSKSFNFSIPASNAESVTSFNALPMPSLASFIKPLTEHFQVFLFLNNGTLSPFFKSCKSNADSQQAIPIIIAA